ncbi:MAG: ABC-type transport auxiliary lipoprotein family protein [Planctomycetota bacterium]
MNFISCRAPTAMRALLPVMALLTLGGCSGLLSSRSAAPVTYVLRPAIAADAATAVSSTSAPVSASTTALSLQVQRVAAAPGYSRDEILLTQPDRRLDVYAASRWPDALPVVVERLVVDALRQHGGWSVVHDAAAPFAADLLLRVTVRRFDAEYTTVGGPPTARVVLDATLARRGDRAVLAAFTVEASSAAGEERMSAIVAAFERATGEALSVLARQAAAEGRKPK